MTCSLCDRAVLARGWCSLHYGHWLRNGDPLVSRTFHGVPDEERFWLQVEKTATCWLWTGRVDKGGYGLLLLSGRRRFYVHRYAYELLIGPIPDGLEIDHLCRVRNCVNPAHMEPVTHKVNSMRGDTIGAINAAKTHCPHGHEYTGPNTILARNKIGGFSRRCRECRLRTQAAWRAKVRASGAS